mgnify:CR=1 FL=1
MKFTLKIAKFNNLSNFRDYWKFRTIYNREHFTSGHLKPADS